MIWQVIANIGGHTGRVTGLAFSTTLNMLVSSCIDAKVTIKSLFLLDFNLTKTCLRASWPGLDLFFNVVRSCRFLHGMLMCGRKRKRHRQVVFKISQTSTSSFTRISSISFLYTRIALQFIKLIH